MWDPTLPESGAQAFESISKHVLRCSHVFYGRLRGLCTWHLALAALHGHHDLRSSHSSTYPGTRYVSQFNQSLWFVSFVHSSTVWWNWWKNDLLIILLTLRREFTFDCRNIFLYAFINVRIFLCMLKENDWSIMLQGLTELCKDLTETICDSYVNMINQNVCWQWWSIDLNFLINSN